MSASVTARRLEGVLPIVHVPFDAADRIDEADLAREVDWIFATGAHGLGTGMVSEVLKLSRSAIEPAPALSEEQARLIRRVANIEAQKRMVLLLDPSNMLDAGELDALAAA